jgi:hypothetical protein
MYKESNRVHTLKELSLQDGEYLYAGLLIITVKNGKQKVEAAIGCYHGCNDQKYSIDTTMRARKIMPVIIDIPKYITRKMSSLDMQNIRKTSNTDILPK